ncbi:hypothetical protein XGA_4346 [Xanthomonas hortorum ATCC 19865]|nr:hypothetical protein XGA_4346 [Xanthomonas hortorum ATCC 19865]
MAATLGVIATGTGQGEITRRIRIVADHRAQRGRCATAEPGLRDYVFQGGVAERLAIGAQLQAPTAMQAAGFPTAVQ